ncbi:venom allergen-1-like [Cochliomyia hominivorax]
MIIGKIAILLLVVLPAVLAQTNYCNANLCRKGKKHIGCKNKGKFASICKNPKLIKMTPKLRSQILDKHNSLRNRIAKGFGKFPSASRMATMVWSNELAKLAEYNVKQCQIKHDQCRNTKEFRNSGQNIAMTTWRGKIMGVSQIVNNHIQNWFNEYKYCPRSTINSYQSPTNGKPYGHFTALVQEKSNHVGCAIVRLRKNGFMQQLMTCNYASTNILRKPVYSQGKAASMCKTGRNKKYKFLCSIKEKYKLK